MIYFLLIGIVVVALVSYEGVIQENSRLYRERVFAMSNLANSVQWHCVRYQLDDGDLLCVWGDICVTWGCYYSEDFAPLRNLLLSSKLIRPMRISTRFVKKWYFLTMCQLHMFLVNQIHCDLAKESGRSDCYKRDIGNILTSWEQKYQYLMR